VKLKMIGDKLTQLTENRIEIYRNMICIFLYVSALALSSAASFPDVHESNIYKYLRINNMKMILPRELIFLVK
jgi:hypothetical protein